MRPTRTGVRVAMRSYDATAEFYDVLHAADYLRTTRDLLDRWLGRPSVGVIDIGAGTGLGTALLADRVAVPVHVVEPSRAMRSVLLSRLAGRPELLSRLHVHTCLVQDLNLVAATDFALCLNTMGTLDHPARMDALAALHRALVPGGRLVLERPPIHRPIGVRRLRSRRLGDEVYGGTVSAEPASSPAEVELEVAWRFDYQVTNGDALVRSATESFAGYVVPGFTATLPHVGFAVEHIDGDIVIASRCGAPAE